MTFALCPEHVSGSVGIGGSKRGIPPKRCQEDAGAVSRAKRAAFHRRHAAEGGVGRPEGAVRGLPAGYGPHSPAAG